MCDNYIRSHGSNAIKHIRKYVWNGRIICDWKCFSDFMATFYCIDTHGEYQSLLASVPSPSNAQTLALTLTQSTAQHSTHAVILFNVKPIEMVVNLNISTDFQVIVHKILCPLSESCTPTLDRLCVCSILIPENGLHQLWNQFGPN